MPATYTFDVFSSLDGYGSYGPPAEWGGYWGKQGPEQRMVLGATTFRQSVQMLAEGTKGTRGHRRARPLGYANEEPASHRGVLDP